MKPVFTRRLLVAVAATFAVTAAQAAYPERAIRFIVPAAAGGGPDVVSRLFAEKMAKRLGQPVVIDNKPGAAGNIGMQALQNAAPDGYTIAYGNNATLATNEFLFSKLPYDPQKLEPIVLTNRGSSLLVVNNDVPVKNVQELVQYTKEHANKVSFASGGTGTSGHVGAELFKVMTGAKGLHIPYKGGPQAVNDVIAGNVQFLFDNISSVGAMVNGGKLRALAVTTKERSPLFPNIPTMDEAGVKGFEMSAWGALVAPPGTPVEIIKRLNFEFNEVAKDPEIVAHVQKMGSRLVGSTPDELRSFIASERLKWGAVVRKSGAKVD
ncbi:MAG: tripartite tricarboxylate transporter substrate binding protein [Comamonas sp.]